MKRSEWILPIICLLLCQVSQAQSHVEETAKAGVQGEMSSTLAVPVRPLPSTPKAGVLGKSTPPQLFECAGAVSLDKCKQQMEKLKTVLNKYGAQQLGEWRWVLVPSQQWELFLAGRGLNPSIPALTSLDARLTFFDDALITGSSGRVSELMDVWQLDREGLLDLAVRHELGHARCKDTSESGADRAARQLERGGVLSCAGSRRSRER